jgi:hypothetical protein
MNLTGYSFPILIHTSLEKQCAAKNRNVAAEGIYKDVDILTFFDIDDIMHPKRLELLDYYFTKYNLESCTHLFLSLESKYRTLYTEIPWDTLTDRIFVSNFECYKDSICGRVMYMGDPSYKEMGHGGHYTIRSSLWEDHKYDDTYGLGEDAEYIWKIVISGAKHALIPDALSVYIKDEALYTNPLHRLYYTNFLR